MTKAMEMDALRSTLIYAQEKGYIKDLEWQSYNGEWFNRIATFVALDIPYSIVWFTNICYLKRDGLDVPFETLKIDGCWPNGYKTSFEFFIAGIDRPVAILPLEEYPHKDTLEIWQLRRDIDDRHDLAFAPLNEIGGTGKIRKSNYEKLYSCAYYGETLDDIYERFNINRPLNFRGHSLSVSDIIIITKKGKTTIYYVDSFGFAEVPEWK